MKTFEGPITWLETETTDGRTIAYEPFASSSLPVPLRGIREHVSGHAGAELLGSVDTVKVLPDMTVHATGRVEDGIPDGTYAVGVDLDPTGRLLAATAYLDDSVKPAFPKAHILITSDQEDA
jgi:hypothetical protein